MLGINFHIKSREETLADFTIWLLQVLTIGYYYKKFVIGILYSHDLIWNSGIKELSTCTRVKEGIYNMQLMFWFTNEPFIDDYCKPTRTHV